MSTYATLADLTARLPGRTISASSRPNTTQAQAWLDEAEAFLTGALAASGCTTTITSAAGISLMRSWSLDYTEGHARQAFASGEGTGQNTDGEKLIEKFDKLLEMIALEPNRIEVMLQGQGSQSGRMVRGYVIDNKDDKTIDNGDFEPMFTTDGKQF